MPKLDTPLASSYAWVVAGKLNQRLEQKHKVVPSTLKGALKTTLKESEKQDPSIKTRGPITGWQLVQVYLGRVLLGMMILVLLWRILVVSRE